MKRSFFPFVLMVMTNTAVSLFVGIAAVYILFAFFIGTGNTTSWEDGASMMAIGAAGSLSAIVWSFIAQKTGLLD